MWPIVANLLSINSKFQNHEYLVLEMMGKNKDPKWTDWHQRKSCCCSVAESCQTLWDLMDCSTLGLPVPHYVLEFAQVQVHWIGDVIQASHLENPLDSKIKPVDPKESHTMIGNSLQWQKMEWTTFREKSRN